jgi:16S rRNA (uracil1498-N3)-methyltransferase
MSLPFFYIDKESAEENILTLSEETSRHIVQVLRMKERELLYLTNGEGLLLKVIIDQAHKKHTVVSVKEYGTLRVVPGKSSRAGCEKDYSITLR